MRSETASRHGSAPSAEAGTALLMILIALFAIGLMSMVIAQVATTELAITANITAGTRSFLPADGASQVLLRDVVNMSRSLGRSALPVAPEFSASMGSPISRASAKIGR